MITFRTNRNAIVALALASITIFCQSQTSEPTNASLAQAAADAARAAADAARAAADAATAAVNAINKLTLGTPKANLAKDPPATTLTQTAPTTREREEERSSPKFIAPSERTLAGLVGTFEIPVSVDVSGDYAHGLATKFAELDTSVTPTKEINLVDSIDAGRSFSRDVRVANARQDQARAQTAQSRALLLPSINLRRASGIENSEPTVNPDKSLTEHKRNDYSLTLSQPLVNLPNFFEYRRRGVLEQAREENKRAADGDAYLQSVSAYLSMVSTRLQADMARDFELQLKELLVYIEKRAAAGASSSSDMSRVRARSQAAISARLEQESAHTAAGVEYVRITNLAPRVARIPLMEELGASLIPTSLDQAIETALQANPDIASLMAEMRAAKLDSDASKSKYLPRLDVELSDTQSYGAGGDISSVGQRDRRAMFVLNWNLYSGGGDARYSDERKARYTELIYRVDDQRRRVIQTISAQYASLMTTRNRINTGYLELDSITSAAESMSKRMLSGNQSLLDLLDVYDRYYQTRTRLVNLHIQEMNAAAQIVRQMQGVPVSLLNQTSLPQPVATGLPQALEKAPPKDTPTAVTQPVTSPLVTSTDLSTPQQSQVISPPSATSPERPQSEPSLAPPRLSTEQEKSLPPNPSIPPNTTEEAQELPAAEPSSAKPSGQPLEKP